MVKPFLLQVHPDVQPNASAKQVNLAAIQNLNAYLDLLQTMADGKYNSKQHHKSDDNSSAIAEIDFVLQLEAGRRGIQKSSTRIDKKKSPHHTSASRRRVELLLPPVALCQQLAGQYRSNNDGMISQQSLRHRLRRHGTQELTKLLRVAGLPAPPPSVRYLSEEEALHEEIQHLVRDDDDDDNDNYDPRSSSTNPQQQQQQQQQSSSNMEEGLGRAHFQYRNSNTKTYTNPVHQRQANYEASRDRFTSNIQWQHYTRLYQEALDAAEAEYATGDLYENTPGARRKLISRLLARIRIIAKNNNNNEDPAAATDASSSSGTTTISFEEQLIAFRRLSILFETHFHFLQLDRCAKMWETSTIVLVPARDYNLSPTALRKRRLRQNADSGFSFTVHADQRVSIYIPMDFGDDELLQELDRNVWDFYDLNNSDGMDDLFPEGSSFALHYEPDIESPRLMMHQAAVAREKGHHS